MSSVISVDHSRLEVKCHRVNLGAEVSVAHDVVAFYITVFLRGPTIIMLSASQFIWLFVLKKSLIPRNSEVIQL